MRKIEKFEAFDGKEFDNEIDCVAYEKEIESTKKYSSYNNGKYFADELMKLGFKVDNCSKFYYKRNFANSIYIVTFFADKIKISGESRTKVNGEISGIDPTLSEFKILINLLID